MQRKNEEKKIREKKIKRKIYFFFVYLDKEKMRGNKIKVIYKMIYISLL